MNNIFKKWVLVAVAFSILLWGQGSAQAPAESKGKDVVGQIKDVDINELVVKIKSLPKDAKTLKSFDAEIEKEYNPKVAIAYAYLLKAVEEKYLKAWKKLLAVLKSVITKEDMDIKLARAGAQIALEMSDSAFTEEEETVIKEKLSEIFEKNTDPFVSIYLGRAYQNIFVGDIKGINELRKVLTETPDEEARFWAAVHLVELDIIDEPQITTTMEKVINSKDQSPEKKKLAEFVLNTVRLKKKLEDKGESVPPPTTKPTSFRSNKFKKIEQIIDVITKHYAYKENIKESDLIEACARGIGDSLDAFSGYMDINQTKRLTESVNMRYAGIGAVVSMRDGWLTIEQLIYNGPAYRAGLRAKDRIIKVEEEYTKGKTLEELVGKLKGIPGTPVKVTVIRAGWEKEKEFTIIREIINMGTVKFDLISPEIAYFKIISFGGDTVSEFLDGFKKLNKQSKDKLKAVIFDVRDNSGGYLDSVLKLLNYFVPAGKVILTAKGDKKIAQAEEDEIEDEEFFAIKTTEENGVFVKHMYANDRVKKIEFKNIYVLVDEGTASAAEIFAGVLHDYGLAKLVGTNTYGKGTIQQIFEFEGRGGPKSFLRLTIGKYFLPSGKSININRDKFGGKPKDAEGGIKPDVVIEPPQVDYWVLAEKEKLAENKKLLDYIIKLATENFELAKSLAINDNKNYKNYPGFNALYKSLKTKLSKNHVREIIRFELRRKIMDMEGKEIIYDLVDDIVLTKLFDIISTDLSISKENLGLVNNELPAKTPPMKKE